MTETDKREIPKSMHEYASRALHTAVKRGIAPDSFSKGLADVMDEVAEVVRTPQRYFHAEDGKPEGWIPEICDVIISSLTLLRASLIETRMFDVTVDDLILEKMEYNERRTD